jgi:hypothetical protein
LREEQVRIRETTGFQGFLAARGTAPSTEKGAVTRIEGAAAASERAIHEGDRKYPECTRTVEFHKQRIMELLDLKTNAVLVGYAVKDGLL